MEHQVVTGENRKRRENMDSSHSKSFESCNDLIQSNEMLVTNQLYLKWRKMRKKKGLQTQYLTLDSRRLCCCCFFTS